MTVVRCGAVALLEKLLQSLEARQLSHSSALASMRKRLLFAYGAILVASVLFAGTAGAQTVPTRLPPFSDFLRGVSGARFETYASPAGNSVRTTQAFEEMRQHILRLYQ